MEKREGGTPSARPPRGVEQREETEVLLNLFLQSPRLIDNYLKPKNDYFSQSLVDRCEHFLVRSSTKLKN